MSALSVEVPFPVFYDRSGEPLENGYVWIGQANLNPQTNPIQVYFDKNLTQPAAQPLRTLAGYIANAGTPAQIYIDAVNFSILVQEKNGTMVYNFPDGTGISSNACGVEYVPPFVGGVPYPVCEKLEQTVSVKDFGAVGDGVTDDTVAIQNALDAVGVNGGELYVDNGIYLISNTLLVPSNVTINGEGSSSVIKAVNNLDKIMIRSKLSVAPFNSNITIKNIKIDGNRSNQTPTTEVTGIKMFSVKNLLIENVIGENIEGHGIHSSNVGLAVDGQRIVNCVFRFVGSGPTNTFGSCYAVTNGLDLIFDACEAYDSEKAGFRLSGANFVLNGCIAKRNGNGGIIPVASECFGLIVNGGYFSNNIPSSPWPCDGIRLVNATRVVLNGVTANGNYNSGVSILNGSTNVTVNGGVFINNGQSKDAPVDTTQRLSGVSVYDNGNSCENILISNVQVYDTQSTKTQEYGVLVDNLSDKVQINSCYFGDNKLGPLGLLTSANTTYVTNTNLNLSTPYYSITDVTITGTTDKTTLFSAPIIANEFGRRGALQFTATGTFSGTNNQKRIYVEAGTSSVEIGVAPNTSQEDWSLNGTIMATSTSSCRLTATLIVGVSVYSAIYDVLVVDTTLNWSLVVAGKLANASDSIGGKFLQVARVR